MSSLKGAFLLLLLTTIVLSSSHPSSSAIAAAEETTEEPLDYPDTLIDAVQEEESLSSSTTTDYVADIHPGKKKNSRQAEEQRNLEHDYWWPTYSPTEVCIFDINFCCVPFLMFARCW